MEKAKYKATTGDIKTIEASNVDISSYEKIYKGSLYCEEDGCMAEVIFYEKQIGGFMRLFKTKSGSIHKSGCIHEIIRNGTRGKNFRLNGENVNVSNEHITDVMNKAYKSFYKKVHNIEDEIKDKPKKKSKKKSSSTIVDSEKNTSYSFNSSPTTNGEGAVIEGKKEPYIYKREVAELREKDDNSYKEVHGILNDIRLYENEVFMDIKGLNGGSMSVYIGTPFKSSHEQEFRLLQNYKTYLELQNEKGNLVICNCVGEIIKVNSERAVQVYNYREVKLDNLGLITVTNMLKNSYN